MSIQLLFKQFTRNIPRDKFWVGFVVRFWHTVDSKSTPGCHALEIASIGLTVAEDKRLRAGFSFPVDLRMRNKADSQVVPALYVAIEDPNNVFTEYDFLESVDFVFAAKEHATLADLAGTTSVTVFSPTNLDGLILEIYEGHQSAKAVHLPIIRVENGERKFSLGDTLRSIEEYPGDILSYCEQHAARLKTSKPGPPAQPVPLETTATTEKATTEKATSTSTPIPKWKKIALVCGVLVIGIVWFVSSQRAGPGGSSTPSAPSKHSGTNIIPGSNSTANGTQPTPSPGVPVSPGVGNLPPATQGIDIPPVPHSGQTISREQLAALGYPEHLAKVKFALASAKAKDLSGIDQSRDWLKANKQTGFLPDNVEDAKQVRMGRRYFNEAIEKKIVRGQANKDPKELQEAAVHLNDFLLENFGSANAHLNLAIAYIESDQSKFALAPAFHTIVFNPEGANGWLQLGLVLAINGEIENGAAALCVTLHIVKNSEKTVNMFNRIEQGLVYDKPNVKEALAQSRTICPGPGWM